MPVFQAKNITPLKKLIVAKVNSNQNIPAYGRPLTIPGVQIKAPITTICGLVSGRFGDLFVVILVFFCVLVFVSSYWSSLSLSLLLLSSSSSYHYHHKQTDIATYTELAQALSKKSIQYLGKRTHTNSMQETAFKDGNTEVLKKWKLTDLIFFFNPKFQFSFLQISFVM